MCDQPVKKYFCKVKRVTEKIYNLRSRQANAGKHLRSVYGSNQSSSSKASDGRSILKDGGSKRNVEGRRIVNIKVLGRQLNCKECNHTFSLCNTLSEERIGLRLVCRPYIVKNVRVRHEFLLMMYIKYKQVLSREKRCYAMV